MVVTLLAPPGPERGGHAAANGHSPRSLVALGTPTQARRDASSITVMSEGAPTRVGGPAAPAPRLT
ncbi:hypothetical protein GA0115259_101806 [Streptomyces sp. MnatMP-M17]|nr:hypothetical protein GA0115259_101806 [Streptomyces sp. MnatMP-M17]